MRLHSYKAAVFDMDGIIFDSERITFEFWKIVGQKYNLSHMEEVYPKCLGVNYEGTRKIFQEAYGEEIIAYDDFKKETSALYREATSGGRLPKKPGIEDLLRFLKENELKIGVASSTHEDVVKQQLIDGGLIQYFDAIIGGNKVTKSKPDPEIYLKACDMLGVDPSDTFAVEDSFNGVRSGCNAGLDVIMVPDMVEPTDEISKLSICVQKDHFQVITYLKEETV